MTVVNRSEDKILLARHVGDEDYKLFAGYIRKGENAEKALVARAARGDPPQCRQVALSCVALS